MIKVKVYLQNRNKLNAEMIYSGLSGKKISTEIEFYHSLRGADVVIDCEHLVEKTQFEKAKPKIFEQIWEIYKQKNKHVN